MKGRETSFSSVRISEVAASGNGIVTTSWRLYWAVLSACSQNLAGVCRRREGRRSVISAKTDVGRKLVDDGVWSWKLHKGKRGKHSSLIRYQTRKVVWTVERGFLYRQPNFTYPPGVYSRITPYDNVFTIAQSRENHGSCSLCAGFNASFLF
jgi:hypothetical protein